LNYIKKKPVYIWPKEIKANSFGNVWISPGT